MQAASETIGFVAIGDEILRGETREANGYALATRLQRKGLALTELRVVPDSALPVAAALRDLAQSCRLIITSGGLGPTDDDGTRLAMADVTGRKLVENETLADGIRSRYAKLGREWIALNLRQAMIPQGCAPLANLHGTAPGFVVPLGDSWVAALPGPPRELRGMVDDHLDQLLQTAGIRAAPITEHCLRVFGLTESGLAHKLSEIPGFSGVAVRSLPSFPDIRLEIRAASGHTDASAAAFADRAAVRLGWRVYARSRDATFAGELVTLLQTRGQTVAVAESCTGGLVGHLLTDVPGVSATLLAGFCTYSNAAKSTILGVDPALITAHGAVSEAVVRAMAEGARRVTGADFAIATSGIAGPGGGTDDKPVGTLWLAVSGPNGTTAMLRFFPGLDRGRFKTLAAWSAMGLLRRETLALD